MKSIVLFHIYLIYVIDLRTPACLELNFRNVLKETDQFFKLETQAEEVKDLSVPQSRARALPESYSDEENRVYFKQVPNIDCYFDHLHWMPIFFPR